MVFWDYGFDWRSVYFGRVAPVSDEIQILHTISNQLLWLSMLITIIGTFVIAKIIEPWLQRLKARPLASFHIRFLQRKMPLAAEGKEISEASSSFPEIWVGLHVLVALAWMFGSLADRDFREAFFGLVLLVYCVLWFCAVKL